jgi:hypothetical protein
MALRKRESKLFDRIKKNIKNVHFTRIESSTVNGIRIRPSLRVP